MIVFNKSIKCIVVLCLNVALSCFLTGKTVDYRGADINSHNLWKINVKVSVVENNAAIAKKKAINIAKKKAFLEIIERFSILPLTDNIKTIIDSTNCDDYITSFSVLSEKVSDAEYRGNFSFLFLKKKLNKFCRETLNLTLLTKPFDKILIVPISQHNSEIKILKNDWRDFWIKNSNSFLLPLLKTQTIELKQLKNISKASLLIRQTDALQKLLYQNSQQYRAIVVLHARFVDPDNMTMHGFIFSKTNASTVDKDKKITDDYCESITKNYIVYDLPILKNTTFLKQNAFWNNCIESISKQLLFQLKKQKVPSFESNDEIVTKQIIFQRLSLKQQLSLEKIMNNNINVSKTLLIISPQIISYRLKGEAMEIKSLLQRFANLGYYAVIDKDSITISQK